MSGKKLRLIQILVSVFILALLFLNIKISSFDIDTSNISIPALCFLLILLPVSLILRSIRWKLFMNAGQAGNHISNVNSFKFLLVGTALNMFMPAGMGDIARSYFGYKWTGIKERMLSVSIYDKIIAIASLSIISAVSFFITWKYIFILTAVLCTMPWLVVTWLNKSLTPALSKGEGAKNKILFWFINKIKRIDIEQTVQHFSFPGKTILSGILLSISGWLLDYMLLFFCFRTFDVTIDFFAVLAVGPLLTLGRLFPFTFNGIGTDEALIIYLFSKITIGIVEGKLLLIALLYRFIMLIIPAIIGTYYLLSTSSWSGNKPAEKSD